jgi:hypothetical protein
MVINGYRVPGMANHWLIDMIHNEIWLVVSTIFKNISQLGRIIPCIMENEKMFETTNQL